MDCIDVYDPCCDIISSPEPKADKVSLKYSKALSSHLRTMISPRPVGHFKSNFIRSIFRVEERLHYVLGQIE